MLTKAAGHSPMMLADPPPSGASPLPQESVFQAVAALCSEATKHSRPLTHHNPHVGVGLLTKAAGHSPMMLSAPPPSGASPLPQESVFQAVAALCSEATKHSRPLTHHKSPVGVGLLTKAPGHSPMMLSAPPPSGASPLPQESVLQAVAALCSEATKHSRPLPQGTVFQAVAALCSEAAKHSRPLTHHNPHVGVGLLTKAAGHSPMMLAAPPPSGASPLPQCDLSGLRWLAGDGYLTAAC